MPTERLSMRMIREVLRLSQACGLSSRMIARSCSIARSTAGEYLRRAKEANLSWPLPEGLDDVRLEQLLFPPSPDVPQEQRQVPIWSDVHRELRKKSVTLFLLWHEYKECYPDGFRYSWFCQNYRAWASKVDPVMRQTHRLAVGHRAADHRAPGLGLAEADEAVVVQEAQQVVDREVHDLGGRGGPHC